ncbi:hypothetical protein HCJ76_17035 [Streptomyces sp. MC1]|uniref:hypothetical protein n=1 Tax=Streptomyces sp. MC1 TaxID=295105 RepID=UPI0018CB450A|nr:hypothetical protein [Streptomyces sp. MC1]MBG7699743.1 hypothetical protein [Streptomyces sp. MC1]
MNAIRAVRAHPRGSPERLLPGTAPRRALARRRGGRGPCRARREPGLGTNWNRALRGVLLIVEPDRNGFDPISESVTRGRRGPGTDRVTPLARTEAACEEPVEEHRRGEVVTHIAEA